MLDTATSTPLLPRPRPITKAYRTKAQAIQAFVEEHGRFPSTRGAEAGECPLACNMHSLRTTCPDLANEYGFYAGAVPSPPRLVRRSGRVYTRLTFGQRLIALVRDGSPKTADTIPDHTSEEPLACQSTTIARVRAEIERDCWWFTLEGQDFPDPRPWRELRMSGDHTLIVKATRVAYLDFAAQAEPGPCKKAPRRPY